MLNIPVEIKALLQADSVKKNFRVHFPNGEFVDLTNADIVSESVSFTESICSQSELKFGLCESPYIEFECVNIGNIKGATIECSIEIVCPSTVSGAVYRADIDEYVYPIPYGRFVVDECKKQADMSHRKVVAYSASIIDGGNPCEDYIQEQKALYNSNYQYDLLKRIQTFYPGYLFNDIAETDATINRTGFSSQKWFGGSQVYVIFHTVGHSENSNVDKVYKLNQTTFTKTLEEFIDEIRDFTSLIDTIPKFKEYVISLYGKSIIGMSSSNPKIINQRIIYLTSYEKISSSSYATNSFGNIVGITVGVRSGSGMITRDIYFSSPSSSDHIGEIKELSSSYFGLVTKSSARKKTKIDGTTYYMVNDTLTLDDVLEIGTSCIGLGCNIGRINRDNSLSLLNLAEQTLADTFDNFVDVWYEDELTKPYGAVCCTWKDSSDEENYSIVYLNGYDEDTDTTTYQTYDLSDNYLIRESTWTESQIDDVLQRASEGLEGLQYMPMDMTIQGRPDIQSGDLLEVETDDTTFNTIVMQRTLKGIQSLLDDITSD